MLEIFKIAKMALGELTHEGRRIIVFFLVSLVAISSLDALAIVLLARVLVTPEIDGKSYALTSISSLYIVAIISLFIVRSLLSTFSTWFSLKEFARQETELGQRKFRELRDSQLAQRLGMNETDYFTRIDRGPTALVQGFLVSFVTAIAESISGFVILLVVLFIQPTTAIVAFVYFLLIAIIQQKVLAKYQQKSGEVILRSGNSTYELLSDFFHMNKLIQVNKSQTFESALYAQRSQLALARAKQGFVASLPRHFMESMLAFGFLVIAASTWAIEGPDSIIPAVVIFATAGFRLVPIVNRIQGLLLTAIGNAPIAKESLSRNKDLQAEHTSPAKQTTQVIMAQNEILKLSDVCFQYDSNRQQILKNVSISFEQGKQYAIVGPSGSGKTTLLDICLGLLNPSEGTVTWGMEIDCVRMGYVPQFTHVSSSNLSGNIALEWEDYSIDEKQVQTALVQSKLSDIFTTNINNNFTDTFTKNMSGGQRQRLGIARALYRDCNFLVLDEATSALDVSTEFGVMQTVNAMRGSVTTLLVAHRLSTVKESDQIIYLDNGMVLGIGTFAELQQLVPQFREQVLLGQLDLISNDE